MSRSLGQSVTLTCTGSSNHVGFYGAGWSEHRLGAAPRTVVLGSSRPSGLPARLSGSHSGSTASLSISGLQAEDEADNYCSTWAHSLSAPAVPRDVGKSDKNLSLPDGSLWLTGVQQQWEDCRGSQEPPVVATQPQLGQEREPGQRKKRSSTDMN